MIPAALLAIPLYSFSLFQMVIDFKNIRDIVTTETLIEVEVDLGW